MNTEKVKHLWVVVKKNTDCGETMVNTCRPRKLAREIANRYKEMGINCVVRKFVSTS